MNIIIQYIFTAIFLAWLFASLLLLRKHAIGGSDHVHRLQMALNDATTQSVETARGAVQAAQKATDAALLAVESNHRLIVLLESQHTDTIHDA